MRKNILRIGVILLFAFLVMTVLYEIPPLITVKTYNAKVDMASVNGGLSYNGQVYQMAYALYIQANFGDRIDISNILVRDNGGKWATIFVEYTNGTPILTSDTSGNLFYSFYVGNTSASTPFDGAGYRIELGVVIPTVVNSSTGLQEREFPPSSYGSYQITANVYSTRLNQNYLIIAILFLIAGLITPVLGLVLKPKRSEAR